MHAEFIHQVLDSMTAIEYFRFFNNFNGDLFPDLIFLNRFHLLLQLPFPHPKEHISRGTHPEQLLESVNLVNMCLLDDNTL